MSPVRPLAAALAGALMATSACAGAGAASRPRVWSDEFNGRAGAPPDPRTWAIKTGGRWMNGGEPELQCYTRRRENVAQDGRGHLRIVARYEPGSRYCSGQTNDYTSARIDTRGLKAFRYGRVAARIKLPRAPGSWPAWWMVGATGNWPAAGEIDILEYRPGPAPRDAHQAIHTDGTGDGHWHQGHNVAGRWMKGWHTYAIDWKRDRIDFRIDGRRRWTRTPRDLRGSGIWRFNRSFGLLLNIAVGNWGGEPDPARFPAVMLVDWVRVRRG